MKRVYLFPLFLVTFFLVLVLIPAKSDAQDLPKIILPSPEAASLFKFQDYPVDMSTGVPQVSIPLYQVKSGSLNVPISISYHASGRRVSDLDGPVSLGWSLNAGGSVSRTVHGSVDFGPYPFPAPLLLNVNNVNDLLYLEKVSHFDKNNPAVTPGDWKDSEYDIFSYYFGNNSGKFIFKDSSGIKTPALLPYKPYVITPVYTPTGGLTEIDILDDQGTFYKFVGNGSYSSPYGAVFTEYDLVKIKSANKTDSISFIYTGFSQNRTAFSQTITLNDNPDPNGSFATDPTYNGAGSTIEHTNQDHYQISRLTEIDFNQGKVVFNLVSGSDKVDNIQIFNTNNILIKTVQFNRSFLDATAEAGVSTSKLDGLVFKDKLGNAVENYAFDYYPDYYPSGFSSFNPRFHDWWGYYNASGQTQMIPYYNNLQYAFTSSQGNNYTLGNPTYNRDPYLLGLESGVLKKITYPTGGSTEFIYENNKYMSNTTLTVKNGPGLRINQIKTVDNNGTTSYKTYTYGNNENGYGVLDMEPDITNMVVESHYDYYVTTLGDASPRGTYRERIFYSDFIPELSAIGERPITYPSVTEYHGTTSANIGKTVYNYDYAGWAPSGLQSNISLLVYRKYIANYNFWNTPSLTTRIDYKNVSGSYQRQKKSVNGYNIVTTENVPGLHVEHVNIFPQNGLVKGTYPDPALYPEPWNIQWDNQHQYPYGYGPVQIPVGYKNLASSTDTTYNDDGSTIASTTTNTYNSHQYISQSSVNTSDGNTINTQLTYPFDYTGNAVLTQMIAPANNMLNYPVEQIKLKNTTLLNATRTNYYNWGTSLIPVILPQTIDSKTLSNSYETRIRYYQYDHGNPISVSKEKAPVVSYQWGYNNTYPVAQVTNALSNEFYYRGFEDTAISTTIWLGRGHTGNKYTTNPSVSFTLPNGRNYVISYWYRSSGVWAYSGELPVTTNSYTMSGGDAYDDIRICPSDAQMTTFTYDPLVGTTSVTDARGATTYYDYDAYQRLINIRDKDKNIVKSFCYNYAGQQTNCFISLPSFSSALINSPIQKSCASNYTGSIENYNVPAGAYISNISLQDANNQASAEVAANGQNYANAKGTCTINTPFTITNTTNSGYQINFTGPFNITYDFLNSGTKTIQVPVGTYSVTIYPTGAYVNHTIALTGQTSVVAPRTTFSNVVVSTSTSLTASVQ